MKDKSDTSKYSSARDAKVPMKYTPAGDTVERIEIKCSLNGNVTKEKIPIFEDQGDEVFLKLKREYQNLIDTYNLWEEPDANTLVYKDFRRCLQGTSRDTWDECLDEVEDDRGQDHFETVLWLLTEKVLGTDALENQKKYLKTTPKPHNMSVKSWINRIKTINAYMLMMEEGASNFTERELIADVISENLPGTWKMPFRSQLLHKADRIANIMPQLQVFETDIKTHEENHKSEGNGSKRKTEAGGERNMCRLPGHKGHTWEDCFNNKNGKKFKGSALSMKDFDKDGKLKKSSGEGKKDGKDGKKESNLIEPFKVCLACSKDSDSEEEYTEFESNDVKEEKQEVLSAEMLIAIPVTSNSKKYKTYLALIDTGTSASLIDEKIVKDAGYELAPTTESEWKTQGGNFKTRGKVNFTKFVLPQFSNKRKVNAGFHLFSKKTIDTYDAIIGRDIIQGLGLDIISSKRCFTWGDISIPMVPRGHWNPSAIAKFYQKENKAETEENEAGDDVEEVMQAELKPAVYEAVDVDQLTEEQTHLEPCEKELLKATLSKHIKALQGLRGQWQGKKVHLELLPEAKPFCARPYKIPQACKELVKKEIERLESIGLLTKVSSSEWAAPSFAIPKKDGTIRFVTDFRGLNGCLKRKPYPIPVIQDILAGLGEFKYATCLDLNMGYYSMELDEESKNLCVICLPWGLYRYNALPMGVKPASDIFQEAMGNLFADMDMIAVYIDDIIIFGTRTFEEHMTDVDEAIERLAEKGMQINSRKCEFAKTEVDYLGFTINRQGIKPQTNKIKAIIGIKAPSNQKEVRAFVGMVNFYKDMWPNRARIMAPLTALCGKGVSFRWTEVEQKAFDDIKAMIAREVMLAFPKYGEAFEIWTDASESAMSGGIKQGDMWLGFFSKKFTPAQQKYPVTEQELLAIVETLKAFRHMLLGQKIIVYTDHKNLTYPTTQHTCDRVLRQRLTLEEYGVDLVYIKGQTNTLADALSRLPFDENPVAEEAFLLRRASEVEEDFPLSLTVIAAAQTTDEHLTADIANPKSQYVKDTRGDTILCCVTWTKRVASESTGAAVSEYMGFIGQCH